jgi:hypothetical protein
MPKQQQQQQQQHRKQWTSFTLIEMRQQREDIEECRHPSGS